MIINIYPDGYPHASLIMEFEFIALDAARKEVEWLRNLFFDIKLWPQSISSISLYHDSEAKLSRDYKIYNEKSRHISLRHEYVRLLIIDGVIRIVYVRTNKNLEYISFDKRSKET